MTIECSRPGGWGMLVSMKREINPLLKISALVACASLMGCTELLTLAGPQNFQPVYAVSYATRGPEYVYRDLGGNRYLLAQAYRGTNLSLLMRYYDRNTGMLTRLNTSPVDVLGYRVKDNGAKAAVRYHSDNPQQLVFFTNRVLSYGGDGYCVEQGPGNAWSKLKTHCGRMTIILSLDGGRSFVSRSVAIRKKVSSAVTSTDALEFVEIKNNTAYFGFYLSTSYEDRKHIDSAKRNWLNADHQAVARFFPGDFLSDYRAFIAVLALPLPGTGEAMPATEIPNDMQADLLEGDALLNYDLGQPITEIQPPLPAPPPVPYDQHTYRERKAYIDLLRDKYPEWAARQTNGLPWFVRYAPSPQRDQVHSSEVGLPDDPVEWVKFD